VKSPRGQSRSGLRRTAPRGSAQGNTFMVVPQKGETTGPPICWRTRADRWKPSPTSELGVRRFAVGDGVETPPPANQIATRSYAAKRSGNRRPMRTVLGWQTA